MVSIVSSIDRSALLKKMAELLRAGAAMLAETCPRCGSPLFRLRSGEVLCPIHGKVMVVKSEEEFATASATSVLMEAERYASHEIARALKDLKEGAEESSRKLLFWLEVLERVEKIKKIIYEIQRIEAERGVRKSG